MFNMRSSPHLVCPQCNNYNATLHSTMTRGELTFLFLSTFLVIPPLFLSRHFHHRDERRFFEGTAPTAAPSPSKRSLFCPRIC
jgi:hypothetical protein